MKLHASGHWAENKMISMTSLMHFVFNSNDTWPLLTSETIWNSSIPHYGEKRIWNGIPQFEIEVDMKLNLHIWYLMSEILISSDLMRKWREMRLFFQLHRVLHIEIATWNSLHSQVHNADLRFWYSNFLKWKIHSFHEIRILSSKLNYTVCICFHIHNNGNLHHNISHICNRWVFTWKLKWKAFNERWI